MLNRNHSNKSWFHGMFFSLATVLVMSGCGSPQPDTSLETSDTPSVEVLNESIAQQSKLKLIPGIERQAFTAQATRLIDAMNFAGSPISDEDVAAINAASKIEDDSEAVNTLQRILNAYTLVDVQISPEARVKLHQGEAKPLLREQGWRAFLVRVHNEPRVTARLDVDSKNSGETMDFGREGVISAEDVRERWLKVEMVDRKPLNPTLSGLALEYRIVTIFSRDAGDREGHIAFNIGQGTQDIGFRNDLNILFDCQPAVKVALNIQDYDGSPTTCAIVVQDEKGQLYPLPARRQAPDFFFQEQVYRASGENLLLPPGNYDIMYSRGPEYLRENIKLAVADVETQTLDIKLKRWSNPEAKGWISGDHHIHASGCSHYQSPDVGVNAEVMMRHIEGEALNIGNVLTWGPGWDHQKKNFSGKDDEISTDRNVIRYDVEVSQFPSDHTGHLCLLRLKEDDYPGTEKKADWPSWGLPIMQWAKEQGGVTGPAHSGWGLDVFPEKRLPNYVVPPMNGIGAQEFIVHAAHDAVDFISTVDTPYVWELNMWYHVMNCGFDVKASGETDFPCIYDERVGLGRSYVKVDDATKVNFEDWVRGIDAGRSYVSDGYSHLQDFQVNGVEPGGKEDSILAIDAPQAVEVSATVSAWLDETPRIVLQGADSWDTAVKDVAGQRKREEIPIRDLKYDVKPYWHIERARIDDTRWVPVEVIVNGQVVTSQNILANGEEMNLKFKINIERSSWVALRILAASHTNPVKVLVGGAPIRASKLSAAWCLDGIDQTWLQKMRNIRETERGDAYKAYEHARGVYRAILEEAHDDTATLSSDDANKRQQQHMDIKAKMDVIQFAMEHNNGSVGTVSFDRKIRGFSNELDLKLSVKPAAATIHYTLDGSLPSADSPKYNDGIKLTETTTVSARGFIDNKPCTDLAKAEYILFSPEDFGKNVDPGDTQPGLNYKYYHGEYVEFGDVTEAALVAQHIAPNFTLDVSERGTHFAISFYGFINIPKDGIYTFGTTSNDGSLLYIGEKLVVGNDKQHGLLTATGEIALDAGLHPIFVNYFQAGGGKGLEVFWAGPGFKEQPIPNEVLSRVPLAEVSE